ncbi:dual oxidase maturation factor 1-like isoform X1 [Colletes gigas]|uniref:dual oxidase maturation factor 1-like isoform X1 n=1 Tax=Colletes gigas TaxID=935657 RepID=UPI001C9AA373|nr:dual oxidase maturation factor 1-like isoform X1 [Colletes gigas]
MAIFDFGRIEGFPSRYTPNELPVLFDVTEIIVIVFFTIIGIAYFSVISGNSKKQCIYTCVKVMSSVTIGCLLVVENFGQEWEVGFAKTRAPYRAGEEYEIEALIGMKIGLRSVNVTLQGKGEDGTPLAKETINYNERFWWTWDQGKFGFGPYAGLLQRNYRDAQKRGLPIPILWTVEYLTIDGEGIRFGRFYRTAGWYCHILLWAAFAGWILANIFLQTVGRYAAYFTATTGILQILACIVWIAVHNPTPLVIPFEDDTIRIRLGQHFWMTLCCGIACILIAALLIFMDLRYPNTLSTFLGINPLTQYDEYVVQFSELENIMKTEGEDDNDIKMTTISDDPRLRSNSVTVLKRRSTIKNAQKMLFRYPVTANINSDKENEEMYINDLIRPSCSYSKESSKGNEDPRPPILPKRVKRTKVFV